jgi:uncharacterized SAM-binding protein YcdF (DUF218 family)
MDAFIFFLYKIAGATIVPPGCFFVLLTLLLFIGVFKTKERMAKRIYILLLFLVMLMYTLFMPVTAVFLMSYLEPGRPVLQNDGRPTLVAVLAGGGTYPVPHAEAELALELAEQSYQRLAEGIIVAKRHNWPLIYSGALDEGDPMLYAALIRSKATNWGFEGELIIEDVSRTTWQNMREIAKVVERDGYERVLISTTAYHMRRSIWMAEHHMPGIEIIPWPSGWRSVRYHLAFNSFAPSARAFHDSCTALRELVGFAVYRLRVT